MAASPRAGTMPEWMRHPPDSSRPRLVHVNATARGGGVAEVLSHLVEAQRSRGISVGWATVSGTPEFFELTKRIHHLLHGSGDSRTLAEPKWIKLYEATLRPQAEWFADRLGGDDIVVLHDPQTLGLATALSARGVRVVWHCHIGSQPRPDSPHDQVWRFFEPYLNSVDTVLASREEFAPHRFPRQRRHVVLPAVAAGSPKNRPLSDADVAATLSDIGLTGDGNSTAARVEQDQPLPQTAPMVLQVSRWDPLKGMAEVLGCLDRLPSDVHLVLAGPEPAEIPDDPEGLAVLAQVRGERADLAPHLRRRVHLVTMSMRDGERNALLVNALQRRADVVTQKSHQEGFGLTVTEAMLKGRAVVASDVGGIRAQIQDGQNGLLVPPDDDTSFASAVTGLLRDAELRHRLGRYAATSAADGFLMSRLVADYQRHVHPNLTVREPV